MMKRFAMSGSWVRQAEHGILRIVSLVFSMASAYAIRLFFAPLDVADPGEKFITWAVAIGFGVLGYIVSRGLVHRLMNKEKIWSYAPICLLVELVDIACNYVLAASVVRQAWWLASVPADQRGVLTFITYVVLSAIPLVSLFLAVVDMDLERSKHAGGSAAGARTGVGSPIVPRATAPGAARLATQRVESERPAYSAGYNGSGQARDGGADAKRAAFFSNRQTQQFGNGGARNLMDDPEKGAALAGTR